MLLCGYCGGDLPPGTKIVEGEETYHEECTNEYIPRREQAVAEFLKYASYDGHVLSMGIHVSYLYGSKQEKYPKKKRQKREQKANELLNKVSALRNSNSGSILIHLIGLAKEDQFTGAFDEFADTKLNSLIHDGKFFPDVYRKQRLSDLEECCEFHDFLVLFVSAASTVTTSDFKTKVALDDCILDPTAESVRTFLKEKKVYNKSFHELPGVASTSDLANLQESRSVQFKSHSSQNVQEDEVVDCISYKHRLAEYVSAFSKLEGGGSFLYGIHEKKVTHGNCGYDSKEPIPQPVTITDENNFKDTLAQRIQENTLVCDYDGGASTDADVAQVRLILSRTNVDKKGKRLNCQRGTAGAKEAVVQVSVRPVTGIVFYDKQGPLAYRYDANTNDVTRMNVKEWFRAFTRTNAEDTPTHTCTGNNNEEGVNILPSNIETPLKEVKERLLELLDNGAFDFLCNDAVNKRTDQNDAQGGVVFISQSLAPVLDIPTSALAGHVICDAFIALPGHSVLVLTLDDGDSFSKEVLEYNMSVTRGVTVTLSRFMDECVHPVHGVLPVSTLNNIVSFKAHMERLVTKSSHFVTQDSLVMNPTRYGKILNAFWAGVAETKSVRTECGEIDDDSLRFLTREQCIILVENINSRDVQVMCGPGTGATTLMLEVTRRLSRLGDTLLVCKSREERDRLRKVYPPAVSADELGTLDTSSYKAIVDETNVTRNYPVCSRWGFTNIQEELANLKMRTTAMKRDVDTVKGQIDALESDECQRQINFLFEEMDVLRLFSVKIKRFMTELDRKKKALRHPPVDNLSPVCCGRDLLAIRMKPQLMEFKQRIYGQEDVLDSIKEFLGGDKIHIGYLQTTIDSWIMKQRQPESWIMKQRQPDHYDEKYDDDDDDDDDHDDDDDVSEVDDEDDSAAINLERELERVTQQLQVKMERNSERDVEEIPANLVDVDKGDDSVMKPHVDVPQAAPSAPTPRSVSPLLSQQNISEGRVRSFLPQSNQYKDSDSGDKEKDVTKTGDVRQMSIQFQDMMKRAEDMDESHSSHFDEPSISKGTLSDDYTASQERDMRAAETQICIADIAEQEKTLLTLEEEQDLQKRHLDSLYCDLPDEWLIKVHYLQRHQDVLSLYDVELPEVISEMVRPGPSHIQTAKLEISPEDESHKRPVKRSQIAKLRRFQQGLLKESDLFDIIGNMIVDDEDHLASLQALNGPVYLVGPSSLQVVCPKLHLDAARANTECHVTTDGELVNSSPDTRSRDRRRLLQMYNGTCASTPIPLSPPHPTLTPVYNTPRYWETRTRVRVVKRVSWYVLEIGVVEAGRVDSNVCVSLQHRSWCVSVESCRGHGESLCTKVYREGKQGECHQNTMSSTHGTQATLHYGMVLDVGRGRISFIDLNREIVLARFDESFREDLYPVFSVNPQSDDCTVNMELISGDNIAITDTKMSLIHDALT